MRVYVAGPYTKGDRSQNVHNAMQATIQLLDAGHEPWCPTLFHFLDLAFPRPWENWMRLDLAWLPFAEAMVRLPGESEGADREIRLAQKHNIPIFDSVERCIDELRREWIAMGICK